MIMLQIINWIGIYLLVGGVNVFVIETILMWTKRQGGKVTGYPWTNKQRLYNIVTWPIAVSIFWYYFLSAFIDEWRKRQ